MATCKTCGAKFKNLFGKEYEQSHRCSATIFDFGGQTYLVGHYGSVIADGELYNVLTDNYKRGMICDNCIQKGLDAGDFELESQNNYFGIGF
jgi:hypothetical protein